MDELIRLYEALDDKNPDRAVKIFREKPTLNLLFIIPAKGKSVLQKLWELDHVRGDEVFSNTVLEVIIRDIKRYSKYMDAYDNITELVMYGPIKVNTPRTIAPVPSPANAAAGAPGPSPMNAAIGAPGPSLANAAAIPSGPYPAAATFNIPPSFYQALNIINAMDDDGVLDFDGLQLERLPELPAGVKILLCRRNQLTFLPDLPAGLEELHCSNNQLRVLPKLPARLKKLICDHNQLTVLPKLPDRLLNLFCNYNQLTVLPDLPPRLQALFCEYNQLRILPELPASLQYTYLRDNQLIEPFLTFYNNYRETNNIYKLRSDINTYYAELRRQGRNVRSLKLALGKPDTFNSAIQLSGQENRIASFLSGKPAGMSLENQLTALKGKYKGIASRKGGRRRKTQRRKRTQKRR